MRLRFEPADGRDEEAFHAAQATLLEEFEAALAAQGDVDDPSDVAADVSTFLDWRYWYSTGELDRYSDDDIAEYLLEWCPRKVAAPPEVAVGIAAAVGRFAEFMAATHRLDGGAARARHIVALVGDLAPEAERAMGDPSNFGMAKSLMETVGPLPDTDDLDELQAFLEQRMTEFNALPFEERKAITDRSLPAPPPRMELPGVYIPPSEAAIAAAAESAPILAQIDALRTYLGADGRALTDTGRLKLADGRALVELLDTGDTMDPVIGDRTFKTPSTDELTGLVFVVEIAKAAKAVRVHQRKLVAVKGWAKRGAVERAAAVVDAVLDEGPLSMRSPYGTDDIAELLDDGVIPMLTMILAAGAVPYPMLVEHAQEVVRDHPGIGWRGDRDRLDERVAWRVETLFAIARQLGLVVDVDADDLGLDLGDLTTDAGIEIGPILTLTALGRHVAAGAAAEYGFRLRRVDLADADVAELFELLLDPEVDSYDALAAWQPARTSDDRARLIAEATATTDRGAYRTVGVGLLDEFGVDVAELHMRALLTTPAAGQAALWLVAHGLADETSMEPLIGIGVLVDTMAAACRDPETLVAMFLEHQGDGIEEALDRMWRHDSAETAQVLETLGEHLPDRRLAKAARKALFRHNSLMANKRA